MGRIDERVGDLVRGMFRTIDDVVSRYGRRIHRGIKRLLPGRIRYGLRWLDENFETYVLVVMLTLLVGIVAHEVFRRFVLNDATRWGVRMATYMYVIMSWIGASYAVQTRIHLKIDFVQRKLPNTLRFVVVMLSNVLFVVFMLILIRYLYEITALQRELGRTMFGFRAVVIWPFYAAAVFGMGLVLVRLIQNIIEDYNLYTNEGRFAESEPLFIEKDDAPATEAAHADES